MTFRPIGFALALVLTIASAPGQTAQPPPAAAPQTTPEPPPYGVFESLLGATWVGELPSDKPQVHNHIEMRFTRAENGQGIRLESRYIQNDRSTPYMSGLYVWDPAKKKYEVVYTDANASVTTGNVSHHEHVLLHDLTVSNSNGTVDTVRIRMSKLDLDTFTQEIFVFRNKAWDKVAQVAYHRVPDKPSKR